MGILSVSDAAAKCEIVLESYRTLFIVSTTKGNVNLLRDTENQDPIKESVYLWHSARKISRFFNNPNEPLVISNACISGISAQIVAHRLLQTGNYDNAIVIGIDELSKFVVSGFLSFKALSNEVCKPFDVNRSGLNLGEGGLTLILGLANEESALSAGTILLERALFPMMPIIFQDLPEQQKVFSWLFRLYCKLFQRNPSVL